MAVIDLVPADDSDDLDDAERALLHAALRRAAGQLEAGQGVPVDEALRRVREQAGR